VQRPSAQSDKMEKKRVPLSDTLVDKQQNIMGHLI